MEDVLKKANELLAIQGSDGNWNHNSYMTGMYNGMELIISLFEKRDPVYKDDTPTSLQEAVGIVIKHFIVDEDYRRGWKDNLAMAFVDESISIFGEDIDHDVLHEIANGAADRFLRNLTRDSKEED
jgi:hypothetical protein